MLLGAEFIKANVSVQVCDYAKKEKYSAEQEFYTNHDILVINRSGFGKYDIIFKSEDGCYEVKGFGRATPNEDCYAVIARLSDEIRQDRQKVESWYKLPVEVRKLLGSFIKHKRFFQYIERKSPSDNGIGSVRLCEF